MLRVIPLNPACCAVPLALEVYEIARSAVYLAGDAVPESVKFRHFPRGTLGRPAYEFDSIGSIAYISARAVWRRKASSLLAASIESPLSMTPSLSKPASLGTGLWASSLASRCSISLVASISLSR